MSKKINILLAEDDDNLGMLLHNFLNAKGFKTDLAKNGKEAFEKFNMFKYDFCILDVMMPKVDGFTLANDIRHIDQQVPILFLTAKAMKEDRLVGFESGADDYLTKPFEMEELLARINAILRRTKGKETQKEEAYNLGKTQYNPDTRVITTGEDERKLTTKENQLLQLLVKNKNEILDRNAALKAIWGDDNYFNGRSMDVYVAKLRKILGDDQSIEILNVHGKGFKLIVKED